MFDKKAHKAVLFFPDKHLWGVNFVSLENNAF